MNLTGKRLRIGAAVVLTTAGEALVATGGSI
jgi:hypothetical protein